MKPFKSLLLAIASAALSVAVAGAARPHYGGTLRVLTQGTIKSIDPVADTTDAADRTVHARVLALVFETLVAPDPAGGLRPLLADAWQREADGVRWRFHVRPGVKLHDGAILQSWHVASALRAVSPREDAIDGDAVVVDVGRRVRIFLGAGEPRYAIGAAHLASCRHGPFRSTEPLRLTLRAHDGYWGGGLSSTHCRLRWVAPRTIGRVSRWTRRSCDRAADRPPLFVAARARRRHVRSSCSRLFEVNRPQASAES
jgi:hypothetical protein